MKLWINRSAAVLFIFLFSASARGQEITSEQVKVSIERGVKYLKSQQSRVRGNWAEHIGQPGGVSALCTLAMINCGVPQDDPKMVRAMAYLRGLGKPEMVYTTALQTMVFAAADPEADRLALVRNVRWLESVQIAGGKNSGSWAYSGERGNGDNSNAQFALLALHEAERAGVEVSEVTWRRALAYWTKPGHQHADGAYGYFPGMPASGSMTCAGITSLLICKRHLEEHALKNGEPVVCCGVPTSDDEITRAMQWLGRYYSVDRNPGDATTGKSNLLYYLYGLERVGRLTGQRKIGGHDWFRDGARRLIGAQDGLTGYWIGYGHGEKDPVIGTALALLFLSKGRRPVVMSKLEYGRKPEVRIEELASRQDEWDLHPRGVPKLTRHVEKLWQRDLTWQSVPLQSATLEDLLQTPVLFISGRESLDFSQQEKQLLKRYVEEGGFLFVEACQGDGCNGADFDRSFRALMKELFNSEPFVLPADHAVWRAEQRVTPSQKRPLLGVNACCRTSVVYCPANLSCYWQYRPENPKTELPPEAAEDIDQSLAIGANVLAYATNRQLREKLDQITVASVQEKIPPRRGTIVVPKLAHSGGSDDAPNSLTNLLVFAREELKIEFTDRLGPEKLQLPITEPAVLEHPILFMHGRRDFQFSSKERRALAEYLKRGGFLVADAICSSPEFTAAIKRELAAALPEHAFKLLPADHPIFSNHFRGFDLTQVTLRVPEQGVGKLSAKNTQVKPQLAGIEIDGRLAVVFSPYDLSCALENHESLDCRGYVKDDAARIGTNILLYALQQ